MKEFLSFLKEKASALGFDEIGITSLERARTARADLESWIAEGRHGGMKYLEEFSRREKDFFEDFQDAKSVIVLGVNYFRSETQTAGDLKGKVARYAWGRDYHDVIREKHLRLIEELKTFQGGDFKAKSCVDIQPILEKFAASQAGFGFLGKNTLVLSKKFGPWLFLSEIITNLDLPEDAPAQGNCGTCSACQTACPTGALNRDYSIDARLCIAYLTIEHKGIIPAEIRPQIKDWIFGCDECLTSCPFHSKAKESTWPEFSAERGKGEQLDMEALFNLRTNAEYEAYFRGTALMRTSRKQMLRNACIVLGNSGASSAVPLLEKALQDIAPLVRLHAAWALGRIQDGRSLTLLGNALEKEADNLVRLEIECAIDATSRKRNT